MSDTPWRSTYLRAPKMALTLANRPEFAALSTMATTSLGLKSGADKFFFVTPTDKVKKVAYGSTASRSGIRVQGLDGWSGVLSSADLHPALLNPHQFGGRGRRTLAVNAITAFYLRPQDRPPARDLADYIDHGERKRVHQKSLVQSNASPTGWWRQSRTLTTSPLFVPYNSSYDYGAWLNPLSQVLNGRFVGVNPTAGMDTHILAAVLNTTVVAMMRLVVGRSTGTEGAFDVGPKAVLNIMVPNVAAISDAKRMELCSAYDAFAAEKFVPNAPDRSGNVDQARRDLDLAVLKVVGLSSGGAQHLLGQIYASYGRWRAAVEDVEAKMQQHRKAMNAAGVIKAGSPVQTAAARVWQEIGSDAKLIPSDLMADDVPADVIEVDPDWRVGPQQPLMDEGYVQLEDGTPADLGSFIRAQYLSTLLELGFGSPIRVPTTDQTVAALMTALDEAKTTITGEAQRVAAAYVSGPRVGEVVDLVVKKWLLESRRKERAIVRALQP